MAKAKSDDKAAPNGDTSTKGPSAAQSRRDKLASLETARKKEQRTRTIRLLVICLVLAIGLLAYPVYLFADDYRARNATLEEIGTSIAAAGCDPITTHPATGNQEHVAEGTKVEYAESHPTPESTTRHRPRSPSTSTPKPIVLRSRRWSTTWSTVTQSSGIGLTPPASRSRTCSESPRRSVATITIRRTSSSRRRGRLPMVPDSRPAKAS